MSKDKPSSPVTAPQTNSPATATVSPLKTPQTNSTAKSTEAAQPIEAAQPPVEAPVFEYGQKLMVGRVLKCVIGIAVQMFTDGPGGPKKPILEWNYLMGAVDDEGQCCWDWHYAQWHRAAEMKSVAQHIGGLQYRAKDVVENLQRRSK